MMIERHTNLEAAMEIIEKLNGVNVVRNESGKYGIEDLLNPGTVSFRYRSLDMALGVAREVAAENDRLDA